ncbi:MAG TPA: A24 family peptidase [Polyangia bacterium]
MIQSSLSLILALVAAVWDWRTGTIPNWLTLPPLLLAPVIFWITGAGDPTWALIGAFGCGLPPYILFRLGVMGGGDVKLFAALGAINGLSIGIEMFGFIILAGSLQACVLLYARGQLGRVLRNSGRVLLNLFREKTKRVVVAAESYTEMRMGPALFFGVLLVVIGS